MLALTGLAVLCVCAAMAAPMGAGDGTGHRGMMTDGDAPAMNEERMQEKVLWFQENGIDTTELETALETGDREAVRMFLQENRPADAPEKGEEKMYAMNEGRMQQMMIHKIQANGIDTTELETALENDDMDAVKTFFRENKPADSGTAFREGGSSTR